jgi:hypothetical protein
MAGLAVVLAVVVHAVSTSAAAATSCQVAGTPSAAPGTAVVTSTSQDLPDGWIVDRGGEDAVFLSTSFGNTADSVPVLTGRPGRWSAPADALPVLPRWARPRAEDGLVWSPQVVRLDGRWVMYFSTTLAYPAVIHCLGVAVSGTLTGPYVGDPRPLVCQRDQGGDIDPQFVSATVGGAVVDELVWKSDNNSRATFGPDRIWVARLRPDGRSLAGRATVIFDAPRAPAWARPIVEAPQLVQAPDRSWWLVFSGGHGYASPDYAIGAVRCDGPAGPCPGTDVTRLVSSNRQGAGPGEETVFTHDGTDWLIYAPWHAGIDFALFRPVEAARIAWCPSGPTVVTPTDFPA